MVEVQGKGADPAEALSFHIFTGRKADLVLSEADSAPQLARCRAYAAAAAAAAAPCCAACAAPGVPPPPSRACTRGHE